MNIKILEEEFIRASDPVIAAGQKAYMRDQFEYYGIKSPERRVIQKPFLIKEFLPPKSELNKIVRELWNKPQRDFQYFGQELLFKYVKKLDLDDIHLLEFMVTNKSWWDTIDFIAYKLIGGYFKLYPDQIKIVVERWINSGNIWLQRSALLFQLKYKEDLNRDLLADIINSLTGSNEFFINKAIGWVLREYSRTDSDWVIEFAEKTDLSSLSKREALRLLK